MELNFITYMLLAGLMLYICYDRIKLYFDNTKMFQQLSKKSKFKKIHHVSIFYFIYATILVVLSVLFVITLIHRDQEWIMWSFVFGVLIVTSFADLIRTNIVNTTYYNDEGFYNNKRFIRYNSVKNFSPRTIPVATDVNLYNGQKHVMPTKTLQLLEPQFEKKAKK